MANHLFVITGGTGSGKSSLVEAVARTGVQHMPEAGRAIIQDQVSIGGNSLPWLDRQAFAELMLEWKLGSHHEASAMRGPVICDRGVPDVIGYLTLCELPVPATSEGRLSCSVTIAPSSSLHTGPPSSRRIPNALSERVSLNCSRGAVDAGLDCESSLPSPTPKTIAAMLDASKNT